MKILVPTDFSEVANHALDTAIMLVKKFGGSIKFAHFIEYPKTLKQVELDQYLKLEIRNSFTSAITIKCEALEHSIKNEGVNASFEISEEGFLDGMSKLCEEENYDMVVVGSHGTGGKSEWFIGSNTQKLVRKLNHEVLVVKNKPETIDYMNALFVTGLFENEKEVFDRFLSLATKLGIRKVHIMSVDTSSYFSQPTIVMEEALQDFKDLVSDDMEVSTHFYKHLSVDAGVRNFTHEHEVDLVAISNHHRHPLKRIFSGSNVEMIVNHIDCPILTIDY